MRDLSQEGCIGPAQSQGHNRCHLSPHRPMIEIQAPDCLCASIAHERSMVLAF